MSYEDIFLTDTTLEETIFKREQKNGIVFFYTDKVIFFIFPKCLDNN